MVRYPGRNAETSESEQLVTEGDLEKKARVIVHNDDLTPYDFVIVTLVRIFHLRHEDAARITWTAHNEGQALVAVLPLPEAQRKVGRAHFAAALEGFPLTFTVETEDG